MKTPTQNLSENDCGLLKLYLRKTMDLSGMLSTTKGTIKNEHVREEISGFYTACMEAQKTCIESLREYYMSK